MNIAEAPAKFLAADLLARFVAIVGDKNAITDREAQAPYLTEPRDMFRGSSPVVLRPGSVAEVAEILKLANETATAIVPQGGNTGLVGGQIPQHGEIVLSLNRLDRVREVDPVSNTMTCEAGVTLLRAREAAAEVDRLYPQLLPSEGSCTIGGNLSTNAGGTAALAYGIARSHALGIEVVLPDGRVLNALNKLKKDNTGYDLKDLFIGAEGTLGVITAAVLRLIPRPRSVETAFVGVPSPQAALDLFGLASERSTGSVTSFELMLRLGVELVLRHGAGCRDPLPQAHPWYVLLELSSQARSGLRAVLEEILAEAWSAASSKTPPSRRASIRPRCSGASAKCSAKCNGTKAARSNTTSRCRWPRCRPSSRRRTPPSPSSFHSPGRFRSDISATATSITTSPSPRMPKRPSSSLTGARSTPQSSAWWPNMAARSRPSMASA
jgi:FAD/FMN-containing dehydrogenase